MSYYNIGIIDNFDKEFDYSYSDIDLEYEDIIKKTQLYFSSLRKQINNLFWYTKLTLFLN